MTKIEAQKLADEAKREWEEKWAHWDGVIYRQKWERLQYEADGMESEEMS